MSVVSHFKVGLSLFLLKSAEHGSQIRLSQSFVYFTLFFLYFIFLSGKAFSPVLAKMIKIWRLKHGGQKLRSFEFMGRFNVNYSR